MFLFYLSACWKQLNSVPRDKLAVRALGAAAGLDIKSMFSTK